MTPLVPVSSGVAQDQLLRELRGRRGALDFWPCSLSLSNGSASRPVKLIAHSAAVGPLRPAFVWTHPGRGLVCLS